MLTKMSVFFRKYFYVSNNRNHENVGVCGLLQIMCLYLLLDGNSVPLECLNHRNGIPTQKLRSTAQMKNRWGFLYKK